MDPTCAGVQPDTKTRRSFLDLPPALRNDVYGYAIYPSIDQTHINKAVLSLYTAQGLSNALPLVCKQLFHETAPIFSSAIASSQPYTMCIDVSKVPMDDSKTWIVLVEVAKCILQYTANVSGAQPGAIDYPSTGTLDPNSLFTSLASTLLTFNTPPFDMMALVEELELPPTGTAVDIDTALDELRDQLNLWDGSETFDISSLRAPILSFHKYMQHADTIRVLTKWANLIDNDNVKKEGELYQSSDAEKHTNHRRPEHRVTSDATIRPALQFYWFPEEHETFCAEMRRQHESTL